MQRKIKKQFYVNNDENDKLKKKAEAACMDEATLLRTLIDEYVPTMPPGKFKDAMGELKLKLNDLELRNDSNELKTVIAELKNIVSSLEAIYWQ